jgi:hypothetical protein
LFKPGLFTWLVDFTYDPGRVSYFLPSGLSQIKIRLFAVNSRKMKSLSSVKGKAVTPKRTVGLLTRSLQISSAKLKKFSAKKFGFFAKLSPQVSPIIRNSTRTAASASYVTPYSEAAPVEQEAYFKSWSGTRTPNFRFLGKDELPVNAYTQVVRLTNNRMAMKKQTQNEIFWFDQFNGTIPLFYAEPAGPSHDVVAYNKAVKKLAEITGNDVNNVAVDIAQFRQTTAMIAKVATRLTSAVTAVKQLNFPKALNLLYQGKRSSTPPRRLSASKSTAENWLELQYGWKPLLKDIEGSMKSLAQYVAKNSFVYTASASGRKVTWENEDIKVESPNITIGRSEILTNSRCKVGIRYKISSHLESFLAQTGFTNPINLGWELIPYSFVVDWFIPIGPYLESISAFDGLVLHDGFRSQITKQSTSVIIRFDGPSKAFAGWVYKYRGGYEREWSIVNRVRLDNFPQAMIPPFKSPVSVAHALNAIALLKVAFSKR